MSDIAKGRVEFLQENIIKGLRKLEKKYSIREIYQFFPELMNDSTIRSKVLKTRL